jgi:ADP-ribose pyrophosphatase
LTPVVREKKVSRQIIYKGKILDLMVDQVRIPGGSLHVREVVGHRPAVGILPVMEDGRLLLVRQYRYAVNEVCWEIPAGLINRGEKPGQAARRECREETGYYPRQLKALGWVYSSPGYSKEKIYLYVAKGMKPCTAQKLDEDEFVIPRKFTWTKAMGMVKGGEIVDCKTILALLWAQS